MLLSLTDAALPNLNAFVEDFGFKVCHDVIMEDDREYYYSNPMYLLPVAFLALGLSVWFRRRKK